MSESEANIKDLEQLILDPNLDKLESMTGGFNIFESIGAVRRELRHSDFLAFLLNPSESHNLFDKFTKPFLFQAALLGNNISPIDIDLLDYDDIEVRREWKNIDILLYSKKAGFVCAIENKIDSGEGENQLIKYQKLVSREFPNSRKQLFIYLTIDGVTPSETEYWVSSSYEQIYKILRKILKESKNNIGEDIYIAISHYTELISRHFMSSNNIVETCRLIYREHKQALDLIFSHKPDDQLEIKNFIVNLIRNEKYTSLGIEHDFSNKTNIRIALKKWDDYQIQKSGKDQWTESNRVLMFEIFNSQNGIDLRFYIGPGNDEFREYIYKCTKENITIFNMKSKKLSAKWNQVFKKNLIDKAYLDNSLEDICDELDKNLIRFFKSDNYKKIVDFIDDALNQYKSKLEND
jgi:hypothetical protein